MWIFLAAQWTSLPVCFDQSCPVDIEVVTAKEICLDLRLLVAAEWPIGQKVDTHDSTEMAVPDT